MAKQATAKTPTVAIARVLRSLGLEQGKDFRVRGQYQGTGANRERTGTYVAVLTAHADQVVADNADRIEELSAASGYAFRVSIHFTAGGRMWTWIANYGSRTRDTAPVATADKDGAALDTASRRVAHDTGHRIVGGPAQTDAHPYDGLAQKTFGSLTWACEEAGQTWFFQNTRNSPRYTLRVYRGRVQVNGWYLYGGLLAGDLIYLGATLTIAATAAEDYILEHARIAGRMEEAARQWPKGTRVQGVDSYGVTCMGTVNGVSWGVVTAPEHENYGRTWVDVDWDEMPHNRGTGRRNRPFTDDLIRH